MTAVDYLVQHQNTVVPAGLAAIAVLIAALRWVSPKELARGALLKAAGGASVRAAKSGKSLKSQEEIDELLKAGRFETAAAAAVDKGDLPNATEYLLRAQLPAKAAQLALRAGRVRQAAEIYERMGNFEAAARHFEEIGSYLRAQDLREKSVRGGGGASPGGKTAAEHPAMASSTGVVPAAPASRPTHQGVRPPSVSGLAELAFPSPPESVAAPSAAHSPARSALSPRPATPTRALADQRLATGDVRGAADAYRDAGCLEEAVNLYVNALGAPGEAAPLVAALGHHARASELYALAGRGPQRSSPRGPAADANMSAFGPTLVRPNVSRSVGPEPRPATAERAPPSPAVLPISPLPPRLASRLAPAAGPSASAPSRGDVTVVCGPQAGVAPPPDGSRGWVRSSRRDAPWGDPRSSERTGRPPAALPATLAEAGVTSGRRRDSIPALEKATAAGAPNAASADLHYRKGLAYVAAGKWTDAREAFDELEQSVPGYRDAARRAADIRTWQKSFERCHATVAIEGSPASRPNMRYVISGEIGRGGMAVVYRATDTLLGREVALKFLSDELAAKAEVREMFQREARSVAQLNHPNIVTVYDFGVLDGRAFIAMEYIEGTTLKEMTSKKGNLTTSECLRLFGQLLDAVAAAHDRKLVHRDIKPSNMMVTDWGLLKLMDFGLARSLAGDGEASGAVGTPAYMAPEQMLGYSADARSDIFSAGVSLYEMLSGSMPFDSVDRSKPIRSIRLDNPSVPVAVDEAIYRAMAFDPDLRFQSARDLLKVLTKALDELDASASQAAATAAAA